MLEAVRGKWLRITMAGGGVMELRLLRRRGCGHRAPGDGAGGSGYYNGLTFHRVEPTFVLQGGSPGANEYMGDGLYMRDEPGVAHNRGAVGISTRGRDTGDAQIFVNLVDSPRLDHAYTVFARRRARHGRGRPRARRRRDDARGAGGRAAPVSVRSGRLPRDLTPNRLTAAVAARARARGAARSTSPSRTRPGSA